MCQDEEHLAVDFDDEPIIVSVNLVESSCAPPPLQVKMESSDMGVHMSTKAATHLMYDHRTVNIKTSAATQVPPICT